MQLTIDAGNSSLKVGLFKNNTLLKHKNLSNGCSILEFLSSEELKNITLVISCSVKQSISLRDLPDVKKRSEIFGLEKCLARLEKIILSNGWYSSRGETK